MKFLVHHRDRADTDRLRDELAEAHWSYMDGYAGSLIARGPTLAEDGETATGSIHVVEVPDAAAARAFAFEEPNQRAGVYRDVLLRRYEDRLGRTMWDFPGERDGRQFFCVLGFGDPRPVEEGTPDATPPGEDGDLVAFGSLLADDGTIWLGSAVLLAAADAGAAGEVLDHSIHAQVEVRPWRFGGRPEDPVTGRM